MNPSIFDACSISRMAKRARADLDRFDSWRSGPPEKPENVSVEFETPQIVRLSKEASPHKNASRAWKRLRDLGVVKGRLFTPPNKLPLAIRDTVDLVAICGEHLGVDITIPDAERQSSTLFACQTHKRGLGRNKNKELARGQETCVVTRCAQKDYLVFCGVHFMAEVADILSSPQQIAILPDLSAGCSMADMANLTKVERAWRELSEILNPDEKITPVTYINSSADLKAFCAEHEGIVCTSSNATKVLQWSFEQREKVLFFSDQHLGRWSGYKMNIPLDEMLVWDFDEPMGGLTKAQISKAKILLWKGHCSVHQMFQPQHIIRFRNQYPDGIVISHPECSFEVCKASDYVGSTEYIINTIREAAPGTRWLVGTELNLVGRIAEEFKAQGKIVQFMSPIRCLRQT